MVKILLFFLFLYLFPVGCTDNSNETAQTNSKTTDANTVDQTPILTDKPPTFNGIQDIQFVSPTEIEVSWYSASDDNTASNKIVYLIYQSDNAKGQDFENPTFTTTSGANSFTVNNLELNKEYFFVIRAKDLDENIDQNSNELSITTPAAYTDLGYASDTGCLYGLEIDTTDGKPFVLTCSANDNYRIQLKKWNSGEVWDSWGLIDDQGSQIDQFADLAIDSRKMSSQLSPFLNFNLCGF